MVVSGGGGEKKEKNTLRPGDSLYSPKKRNLRDVSKATVHRNDSLV